MKNADSASACDMLDLESCLFSDQHSIALAIGFTCSSIAYGQTASEHPSLLSVPSAATLIAQTNVNQVRGFAEMAATTTGRKAMEAGRQNDSSGVDRLYRGAQPYADIVGYFDTELTQSGVQTIARTKTATATAWTVRKKVGTIANVVVRNTTPATFELEESTGE